MPTGTTNSQNPISINTYNPLDDAHYAAEVLHQDELQFLDMHQVRMLDEALQSVGSYGEVRLVVNKGTLRFIVTSRSTKVEG